MKYLFLAGAVLGVLGLAYVAGLDMPSAIIGLIFGYLLGVIFE